MAIRANETQSAAGKLAPRVRVWLECDGEYVFGWGMCEILQAVDRTGSIKEAARVVGLSYRHVWDRIKTAEQARGGPLVESRLGGKGVRRSFLTEDGRRLVAGFRSLRLRMIALVEREFLRQFRPN